MRAVWIASIVVVVICLATLSFASPVAAGSKPTLTKKELKALIASAKTKEDHQRLADYYQAETERLEAEAKDHDEMAEAYKKNPNPLAVKHPEAVGEGHCHEMARRFREPLPRRRNWHRCMKTWRKGRSSSKKQEAKLLV